jgi:hypothetical protein
VSAYLRQDAICYTIMRNQAYNLKTKTYLKVRRWHPLPSPFSFFTQQQSKYVVADLLYILLLDACISAAKNLITQTVPR